MLTNLAKFSYQLLAKYWYNYYQIIRALEMSIDPNLEGLFNHC